ncbi:MAG TPA: tetratricopeptide repeat protein, partial [Vicinamibacterales bacterium]
STLQGVLENDPKSLRAAVQLAGLFDREENYSAAADAWGRAQTLNPGNTEIATRRAAALANAGRSRDAVGVLKDALKQQPSDLQISLMLGRAEREAGDLDEAETTARALHTAHPDDERTTELLAQVLEARGRYQDEIDLLKPEIERLHAQAGAAAQTAQLLAAEGLAFQQLHKDNEAIAAFKDGVALVPIDPVRYILLIQGYADAGRYTEALDEADVALQKFPQNAGIQYQQGAAFDRAGRQADAERVFRDLIARDPLNGEALNYLGYMLAEHGTSLDEAVSFIQRALKVEPGNPSYLDSLGFAYVKEGKIDLADEPLTTAADKVPTNSVIQDHLGDLRLKQNRRADAIAAWKRALAGDGEEIDRGKIEKKITAAKKEKSDNFQLRKEHEDIQLAPAVALARWPLGAGRCPCRRVRP